MNLALVYDTETTGFVKKNLALHADAQPHLVQLAAALVDLNTGRVMQSIDVTVCPEGWKIPEESAAVHGITTEQALEIGIPEEQAIQMLLMLHKQRPRIAHNEQFDSDIIHIACLRYLSTDAVRDWDDGVTHCTALMSTPILKLPPTDRMIAAGRRHYKTPKLSEAYEFFVGHELTGAHNAMVDVQACLAVYCAIKEQEKKE